MTVEPASTRANRINSDCLALSYVGVGLRLGIRRARGVRDGAPRLVQRIRKPYEALCAAPESMGEGVGSVSTSEARAKAWVSTYSRMLVSLPPRTVMAKIQSSTNVLFVALIFPFAKPTTRTRSPCATNSRGSVDVSIDLDAVSSKS